MGSLGKRAMHSLHSHVAGIESAVSPGGEGVCFLRIDVMALSDSLVELIAGYHIQVFQSNYFRGHCIENCVFMLFVIFVASSFFKVFIFASDSRIVHVYVV